MIQGPRPPGINDGWVSRRITAGRFELAPFSTEPCGQVSLPNILKLSPVRVDACQKVELRNLRNNAARMKLVALDKIGILSGISDTLIQALLLALGLAFGLAFGLGGKEAAAGMISRVMHGDHK